jgi:small subunit ribosomal protein S1
MKDKLEENNLLSIPKEGSIVEGEVVGKGRAAAYINLGIFGTGIIFGREFYASKEELKDLENGESVSVKVVKIDGHEGYVELSRHQARKDMAWDVLEEKKEKSETITVKIEGANKGGLLAKLFGISAFLPSSQLSSENYPHVEGGDRDKILKELQELVGEELEVRILDLSKSDEKIILSEKIREMEKKEKALEEYEEGDVVEGQITGIVDFGAFIKFGEGIEGLIHISELDWSLVSDPSDILEEGEKIEAKIINISDGKVFLSLKALKEDPWKIIKEKHSKGDVIKGKVTKFVSFGSFVELESGIQGLCHISEFGTKERMEAALEVGEKYDFEILSIDAEDHRLSLRLKEEK